MAYRKTPGELAKFAEKKAVIVESAIAVLAKDGLEGNFAANVATRSGFAHGALYTYFADKDELVNAAITELMREHLDMLMRAASGREAGNKMLAIVLRTYIEIAGKARRVMPILRESPLYRNAVKTTFRNFIAEARPHGRYDDALVRAGAICGAIWETAGMQSRDEETLTCMLLLLVSAQSRAPSRVGKA